MMRNIPDQLDCCQYRTYLNHKHHRVLHHRTGIQLTEGIRHGSRKNSRVDEGLIFDSRDWIHGHPQKTFPACISRCSRIGPRLRAGKNVRAPTIKMVETSKPANRPPVTGNVPADSGTVFFLARLPAMASTGMIMKNRPRSCAVAVLVLYHMVFTLIP